MAEALTNDHDHPTPLGLRGRMEAGWSRMNDLIVIQASQVRESVLIVQIEDSRRAVWCFTRVCVLTSLRTLITLETVGQSSDTTIGTTLKGGRG
jgi:hypothetical protein